jgi:dipeptidase D
MTIADLEPKYVWQNFDGIRKVPRPSKHEEKIREYLLGWAKERGFETRADKTGNVVIKVPATKGHEKAPTVVVQAHMDMVCEKNNDVRFDFMTEPIRLKLEGDWLKADGTTLGSDNGIGLAAGMALAEDPEAVHGPLEILVTVDEETGLTGAAQLDASMLDGRVMLNLDTEELGELCIGCAGGGDSTITLPAKMTKAPDGAAAVRVKVGGLRGGHSGMDIPEQRGNAIKALARILWNIGQKHPLHLVRLDGGGVHNAIPREATAEVVVQKGGLGDVEKIAAREAAAIKVELGEVDPGLRVEVAAADVAQAMDAEATARFVNLLLAIPHGVDAMSKAVPGLVETSNNLASVWTKEGKLVIGTSSRSSVSSALQAMRDRIRAAATLAGATVEENEAYPGWNPNPDSKVLDATKRTYVKLFGEEPKVIAVHAGLECGILGEMVPGMDMVSFGPTIEAPHSPDERVNIPSVETFYKLLKEVMKELAQGA